MTKFDAYRAFCAKREVEHQLRKLQETQILNHGHALCNGREVVNFSSNDYLGLSQHPILKERARDYAERYGVGSTASRLVVGNGPLYASLEAALAQGKGCEAALVMAGGYQTNLTVIAALADESVIGKRVIVLADRLAHNSLLQGVLLSGARLIRFHHNDYEHLENLLTQHRAKDTRVIIVSESVFSMDGDRADVAALVHLSRQYDALLYLDEAHATGLFGKDGFGLAAEHQGDVDVVMGTCGKALGGFGSYIGCSAMLRNYLIQRCGGFVYSTALPPPVLGALEAAVELLPQLSAERAYVLAQAERVRDVLRHRGWDCGASTTQIIPIILGHELEATAMADQLKQKGMLVSAIRPPTVPRGTSRLRISLSAAHRAEDMDRLLDAIGSP